MAFVDLYDQISKSLSECKFSMGIFIDLFKAFDIIDHQILLKKLAHLDIRGIPLQWFTSYFSERKQYVHINDYDSKQKYVKCGVPQGSILGPLLFLIYVNDMPNCSKMLGFILFTDDTNIFYAHNDIKTIIETVNSELKFLSIWFRANRLSLNISKKKFILFSRTGNLHKKTEFLL